MSEGQNATKLYLPIVTVVSMLSMLGTVIWFAAVLSTKTQIQGNDLQELQIQMRDVPSRTEYNALKDSISEVKTAIDDLRKDLAKK